MKNKIIYVVLFVIVVVCYLNFLEKRDEQLMSLCADHETQTLYKCNEK